MRRTSTPIVYLLAFGALAIGLALRWLLDPWLGPRAPFSATYGAVAIAAWLAGYPAGIVVAVTGYIAADWLFISPRHTILLNGVDQWADLALYAFASSIIIGLAEVMHITRRRAYALRQSSLERQARLEFEMEAQKQRQAALEESERRFRRMADAAPVLIWISDETGSCTWFNKPWLDFTGRLLDQEIGYGWAENVHPEDRANCVATFQQNLRERQGFTLEYRLRRYDGAFRWVLDHGTPLYGSDGDLAGFVGSCIDITDRREVEAQLREADRLKDEFLATLAHELRNPLAPIRNSIELLRMPDVGPSTAERAKDVIDRQLRHMTRLVDDLLDVSRISRGRITLRRQRVVLADVLRDAVESVQPLLEEAEHRLTIAIPAEPIHLDADPARLAQVFWNLLHNAAKYTDPGGDIELVAERDDGNVVVRVRDNGIGIAPEHQAAMFRTYTQLNPALEHSRGGLGIGLWLARELVHLHHGEITVYSEGTGKGSEFTVRLPAEAAAETRRPTEPAEPKAADHGGFRILVVEDHEDSADTLATLLTYFGNDVRVARDGVEGVEAAGEFHPDIILLDVGLPRLNGYEAARRIRRQEWSARSFMVALTGWGQDQDKQDAEAAGFDHHITKPVDRQGLQSLLERAKAAGVRA